MKRMKKFLSLLLACMLMLNGTVLYAVGEEALPSETETASDVTLSDVVEEKYDAGDEIVEWREEGVKHYYLGDGSIKPSCRWTMWQNKHRAAAHLPPSIPRAIPWIPISRPFIRTYATAKATRCG